MCILSVSISIALCLRKSVAISKLFGLSASQAGPSDPSRRQRSPVHGTHLLMPMSKISAEARRLRACFGGSVKNDCLWALYRIM